jgi:uncharacterized membrane protein
MKASAKVIIVSSILGFLNALYLTILFVQKSILGDKSSSVCDINSTMSCSSVITSPYSKLFGLPVCTIAMFVYPAIVILAYLALKKKAVKNYFYAISLLATAGMMMNIIYTYIEYEFIRSVCLFCLICLVLIVTNLVMSIRGYSKAAK